MTWEELKLATIQKMFSANGSTIPTDDSTRDYLAAMPQVANEGILMLSTAGKFLVKSVSISINPIPNILGKETGGKIHLKESGRMIFSGDCARSYYFEATGKCTATISAGDYVEIVDIDSINKYTPFKGLINNEKKLPVTIVFDSEYPYSVKNIALYRSKFTEPA